jgi:enoyl-CoA hydratase
MPDAVLREMAFCGTTLTAARALAIGFVNDVSEDPRKAALNAASEIAKRAALAVTASKRTIDFARDHTVAESLDQVALLQSAIWSTSDVMGAIAARAQKTTTQFTPLKPRSR